MTSLCNRVRDWAVNLTDRIIIQIFCCRYQERNAYKRVDIDFEMAISMMKDTEWDFVLYAQPETVACIQDLYQLPGGCICGHCESIGEVDFGILREREKLARNGLFLIDIRGFVSAEDAEALMPEIRKHIMDVVNDGGWDSEKDVANTVRSYL
jgi:hypothetical protein